MCSSPLRQTIVIVGPILFLNRHFKRCHKLMQKYISYKYFYRCFFKIRLFERIKNFTINISIGNDNVDSVNDYLNEFEKLLSGKLSEIFDKNLPFIETEDKDNCKFCAYKNLCGN